MRIVHCRIPNAVTVPEAASLATGRLSDAGLVIGALGVSRSLSVSPAGRGARRTSIWIRGPRRGARGLLEPPHPFGLLFGAELLRLNCKGLRLVVPFRQFL